MNYIKEYLKWFVIINTGVMLIVAINTTVYGTAEIMTLWKILAASAVTSLVTTVAFSIEPKRIMTPIRLVVFFIIFYVVILAVMVAIGIGFDWIDFSAKGISIMAMSVAGVFFVTVVLSVVLGAADAKKMNEALKDIRE